MWQILLHFALQPGEYIKMAARFHRAGNNLLKALKFLRRQ
jgi:hypothetical protein